MSRKDPQEKPASQATLSWVMATMENEGAKFIQVDFENGRYWFEAGGKTFALDLTEPQGPLPDLTGKKKVSQPTSEG